MSAREIVNLAASDEDDFRENWRAACQRDSGRAVEKVIEAVGMGDHRVLEVALWSLVPVDAEVATRVVATLLEVDACAVHRAASYWLEKAAPQVLPALEREVLALSERLLGSSERRGPGSGREGVDVFEEALNSTAGAVAEIALDIANARKLERGSTLRDLTSLFSEVVGTDGWPILASRLAYLFAVDPAWTRANLVPRFRWRKGNSAAAAWASYLWAPRLDPELYGELRDDLWLAVKKASALGEHASRVMMDLAVEIALEGLEPEVGSMFLAAMREVAPEGRRYAVGSMRRRLERSETPDEMFRSDVRALLERFWPREKSLRDSSLSVELAKLALACGGAASEALEVVQPLLIRAERLSDFSWWVKGDAAKRHPKEVVRLLGILSGCSGAPPYGLSDLLASLAATDASVLLMADFVRLTEWMAMKT